MIFSKEGSDLLFQDVSLASRLTSGSRRYLYIFIVTLVTAIIFTLASSTYASAAPISNHPSDYSKKTALYNAFRQCVKHEQKNQTSGDVFNNSWISPDDAKSGKWWHESTGAYGWATFRAPSFLASSVEEDGRLTCNKILSQGVTAWGFDGALDLLCSANIKRTNGGSCQNSKDGDFDIGSDDDDALSKAIQKKAFGGSAPVLRGEHRYLIYEQAFYKGCSAVKANTGSGNRDYKNVKIYDSTAKKVVSTRFEGEDKGTKRWVYVTVPLAEVNLSCEDISKKVTEYSDAYKDWVKLNPNAPPPDTLPDGDPNTPPEDAAPTCVIDGVGWLICPVVEFLGTITDASYTFVESLLIVQPLFTTGDQTGAYDAWKIMRTFANSAFVIAFLIIIFSQLTSTGVSNYGVKRMLPRLVIAAILVNMSFFITALAVDLSNIVGGSMKSLLDGVTISTTAMPDWHDGSNSMANIVGIVLAGGGVVAGVAYAGLAVLIPLLIAAALAIFTVLAVLVIRQALIILLVVVAPLAFVAFLLPNTEGLFTKWRKLLTTLLLMYPIIGALFGLSALASKIVMVSANGNILVQISGAMIAIIPLALTPLIMKTAGGVLNRVGAFVNDKNRGPIDGMRKRARSFREDRQNLRAGKALTGNGRVFGGGQFKRAARRNAYSQMAKSSSDLGAAAFSATDDVASARIDAVTTNQLGVSALNSAKSSAVTSSLANNGNGAIAGAMGGAAAAYAGNALSTQVAKAEKEAIKDVQTRANFDPGQIGQIGKAFSDAVKQGDSISARAYQEMLLSKGNPGIGEWSSAIQAMEGDATSGINSGSMSQTLRNNVMDSNPGIKSSNAAASSWATDGKMGSLDSALKSQKTWESLSNEEISSQKPAVYADMFNALKNSSDGQRRAQEIQGFDNFEKLNESLKAEIRQLAGTPKGP